MRFLIALLALTCGVCAQVQPNIVLILADDLGYGTLGCYGNKEVSTPRIDQLAASGIRLTDFHTNGPMCSPTRASLLTEKPELAKNLMKMHRQWGSEVGGK